MSESWKSLIYAVVEHFLGLHLWWHSVWEGVWKLKLDTAKQLTVSTHFLKTIFWRNRHVWHIKFIDPQGIEQMKYMQRGASVQIFLGEIIIGGKFHSLDPGAGYEINWWDDYCGEFHCADLGGAGYEMSSNIFLTCLWRDDYCNKPVCLTLYLKSTPFNVHIWREKFHCADLGAGYGKKHI